MPSRRSRKSADIARQFGDLSIAVPQVVSKRLARMALAGANPTARDKKELQQMIAEKNAAFVASWTAMTHEAMRANAALAQSWFAACWGLSSRGTSPMTALAALQDATLGVVAKGIAPVRRKAVANAKRLSRSR
ncbi:MAG: polyhydroxyalkanoate granule-associated phasin [Tahibacter sp.]